MPDILQNFYLDRPAVHRRDDTDLVNLVGWAVGAVSRVVGVEVVYHGRIIGMAPVDVRRADVEASHPSLGEDPCGFACLIDVGQLAPQFELALRIVLEDGSRVAFGSVTGRHGEEEPAGASPESAADEEREATIAAQSRLEAQIAALIEAGLAEHERTQLGDTTFLDRLDVRGRRVLVAGSGGGELARLVRSRGAGLVDVLEPDAHLAQVERLITAHEDVTRVFFFDRDIAEPASYSSGYGLAIVPAGLDGLDPVLAVLSRHAKVLVTSLPVSRGKVTVPDALRAAFPHHEALAAPASRNGKRSSAKQRMVALAAARENLDAILGTGDPVEVLAQPNVARGSS